MTPYLQRRALYAPLIENRPSLNLGLVVVIPAHREDRLLSCLLHLEKCRLPACDVEVIVVLNDAWSDPPAVKEAHRRSQQQVQEWASGRRTTRLKFFAVHAADLPDKYAGVGLARKIGMDEACFRLERVGNPQGVIACYDADSRCAANYLTSLDRHFAKYPRDHACSVYFEHPLLGADYPEEVYSAIAQYELHLRYYLDAQRFAGFPHAFQTIGSSMAVRCRSYQEQGGMNRRKAGEDFYFLHKFIQLGHFRELNDTKVVPSPRPSDRVPFGTGKAVRALLKGKKSLLTYHPQAVLDLKAFLDRMPDCYTLKTPEESDLLAALPEVMREFLVAADWQKHLAEARGHSADFDGFQKRFFRWFNAFQIMKFFHFARERAYPDLPVVDAARWLAGHWPEETPLLPVAAKAEDWLRWFREIDRRGWQPPAISAGPGGSAGRE